MVIANTLNLQEVIDESEMILKDNQEYLILYNEIEVPHIEMERIITILHTRGRTCVETLIEQLARNEYDHYLQRRYVYALMCSGEIEFDLFTPINEQTILWTDTVELV